MSYPPRAKKIITAAIAGIVVSILAPFLVNFIFTKQDTSGADPTIYSLLLNIVMPLIFLVTLITLIVVLIKGRKHVNQ